LLEVNDVEPFTSEELIRTIAACQKIGRAQYERLRAHAMVMLMRYAGLRVSDVVTLSRDHIKGSHLEKRAVKNRRMIRVELHPDVLKALELLPHPKAALRDCRLYFSGETASLRSLVKGAQRTLAAVFDRAKVDRGHPHRFRHTLASGILGKGGTVEDAASILADSPATIRRIMRSGLPNSRPGKTGLPGWFTAQIWHRRKKWSASDDSMAFKMVARDGIEPPTPAFSGLRSTN